MKHPERTLQKVLVAQIRNFYPDLLFWHTPNGEERHRKVAAELKAMGVLAGVPDLLFPTLLYAMELKAPGEGLSSAQEGIRATLVAHGWEYDTYTDWRAGFAAVERRIALRAALAR